MPTTINRYAEQIWTQSVHDAFPRGAWERFKIYTLLIYYFFYIPFYESMKIIIYRGLNTDTITGYSKLAAFLEAGNFQAAEVKKVGNNLYRARLNRSDRLLFSLHKYQNETCILVLEHIRQHAYEQSRFLHRGAVIDEEQIPVITDDAAEEVPILPYLNPRLKRFNILDKVLSFDDEQEAIYEQKVPIIIIGSAGSGKTALTLEKMKAVKGTILYVTRSAFLVKNAHELYFSNGYHNEKQEIDFLSFREYLESIRIPKGKEVTPRIFANWISRQRLSKELADSHRLFEEIQGAITGTMEDKPYLTREEYLALGVRQSIYPQELRDIVYDVFERYIRFLEEQEYFDPNIVAHAWLQHITPRYDLVVVDEVQDLTTVQLLLILRSLHNNTKFLLCGDSNQIVHPNFFSWAKVKTLFWKQQGDNTTDLLRILSANFRNSPQITDLANRLLHIKHARFGSVDKESNYLVTGRGPIGGRVTLLANLDAVTQDLNRRTAASTRFAILVLHSEQKAAVRKHFRTPLVFSIQEAKGLEYENVLLYGFISSEEKRFREIIDGLESSDLQGELKYARARDKGDKSLEIYKFYINALYVAVTRAVKNLYLIESQHKHPLLFLLGLKEVKENVEDIEEQKSSIEEWRQEAHRLELQGKEEQAAEIREQILKKHEIPWKILDGEHLTKIKDQALVDGNKKARVSLLEYAVIYQDQPLLNALAANGVTTANAPEKALATVEKKYYLPYSFKNPAIALREVEKYGVDFRNQFNQTPLMIASYTGRVDIVEQLIKLGANTTLVNSNGLNAFQIAIERSCNDSRFAQIKLPALWDYIIPPSLDIRVDDRLIKIDQHLMEHLMLSIVAVLFYQSLVRNWLKGYPKIVALSSSDFEEVVTNFPDSVIPERRKKRSYISSILSKNEATKDGPYNRKLFLRVARGQYLPNPGLALRIDDEWHQMYDLLASHRLGMSSNFLPAEIYQIPSIRNRFEQYLDRLRELIDDLPEKGAPSSS